MKKEDQVSFLGELSGSIGDLGTFLPYVLGAISVAGLNPASIFSGFGLFYTFCGISCCIPDCPCHQFPWGYTCLK